MNKFCVLRFCDDYSFLRNKIFFSNKKIREYYIQKFCPYEIKELCIGDITDVVGVEVILPITKEDAIENKIYFENIVEKTINRLKDDVVIVDYGEVFYISEELKHLDSVDITTFFIKEILSKAIKQNSFTRKDVSVSIIAGEFEFTEIILNEIYDNLNFLNIVDRDINFHKYDNKTDAIFCDCGLEVSFSNSAVSDIVINLNKNPYKFINSNDNAVIIDLANCIDRKKVKSKVIQEINIKVNDRYIKDRELELILYAKSYVYRQYKNGYCEYSKYLYIKNELYNINAKFNNYKV